MVIKKLRSKLGMFTLGVNILQFFDAVGMVLGEAGESGYVLVDFIESTNDGIFHLAKLFIGREVFSSFLDYFSDDFFDFLKILESKHGFIKSVG